jgi:hypothetical protein
MTAVLSPVAVAVLLPVLVFPVLAAVGVLEDELPPHAASPTTAAGSGGGSF